MATIIEYVSNGDGTTTKREITIVESVVSDKDEQLKAIDNQISVLQEQINTLTADKVSVSSKGIGK